MRGRATQSHTLQTISAGRLGHVSTGGQQTNARRWWLPFLATLVAALAAILPGTTASASTAVVAGNRVGAFNVAGEFLVRPLEHVSAGQHRDATLRHPQIVVATGVAAKAGSVSSRVASHLEDVKGIAAEHGVPLNRFGNGYLWANKDANLTLRTPTQLASVKARGFTPQQVTKIRDYYRAVDEASSGANPSASYRADLMQYYLDNW